MRRPRGECGRVYLVVAKIACFGHGRNEKMELEGCGMLWWEGKKISNTVTLTRLSNSISTYYIFAKQHYFH
jgi:hypothetical protein